MQSMSGNAEEDIKRFGIQHVNPSSDDKGMRVPEAEMTTTRARREDQETLELLAKARRSVGEYLVTRTDAHRTGMHSGQARRRLFTQDALEGRLRNLTLYHALKLLDTHAGRCKLLNAHAGRLKPQVVLIYKKLLQSVTVIGSGPRPGRSSLKQRNAILNVDP